MKRVEITRPMMPVEDFGLFAIAFMQVCCVEDATDEEILEKCNKENPTETSCTWDTVYREGEDGGGRKVEGAVPCNDHEGRIHLLVSC